MRIGISSGTTITGLIGLKRQTFTAIGDVVNIAARLERACPPGRVLIDRQTFDHVSHVIEARKKRAVSTKDETDPKREQQLEALHERLAAAPRNADLLCLIGRVHLELQEPTEALEFFEQALELDPEHREAKLGYAEAWLKLREADTLPVKGRRRRVEAYEVIGLKDPLEDRAKIPQKFYDEFRAVADLIKIPPDIILPVEAMDGSVGHSKVVAVLSYALAQALGLPEKSKQDLLVAAFLADIGKEIVPHSILNRGGSLSNSELDLIKLHTGEGVRIIKKMGYENEAVLQMVAHSHESFNGTGYPDGLKGDAIPIGSRIIAVADTYDALTSKRPFRDAWERHAALDQIDRGVQKGLFDPKIVQLLRTFME
jgi:putative nucleotidyltransferase with HDIG domain